jgi:cytochrome c-type biogenesis protein CcmH
MENDANAPNHDSVPSKSGLKAGWLLLGAAAILAAGSIGYNVLGSQSGDSGAEESSDGQASIEELRAAAENSTDDAGPWAKLAFAYFERDEFLEAAEAYEKAVAIDDSEAILWSALGEARVFASERDPLPPAALKAFERAIELDPTDPRSRYFLAVKKDLDGDNDGAMTAWLDLLSDTPVGAPWESDLVRTIQQVSAINEVDVDTRLAAVMEGRAPAVLVPGSGSAAGGAASANVRGPSAAEVAAASRIPPGEQLTMAEGMVAQLEARLENDPKNPDGWVMLMRSRMTLGEPQKAKDALDAAVAANPGAATQLRAQAQQIGVR